MAPLPQKVGVLVVGSGNAGFAAALSAAENGAKDILIIDKCPEEWVGGNSYFTAGAYRIAHNGLQDLLPIVNNVSPEQADKIDLTPYTVKDFQDDMERVCMGRSDPVLARALIENSNEAIKWLASNGIRFQLSFNRQAYEVDGRIKFWGGLHIKTQDGGKGLIEDYLAATKKRNIHVSWSTALTGLQKRSKDDNYDVEVSINGKQRVFTAGDRKSTRLNSSHSGESRMPSSA